MKKFFCTALCFLLLSSFSVFADDSKPSLPAPPAIDSSSAVLINLSRGETLFEKNAGSKISAGGLAKLMTLYLANERLKSGGMQPSSMIPISEKAWRAGGSRMWLEVGTQYAADDVMKGIAVVGGNDASIAMSEYLSGAVEAFVGDMNKKASALGMKNSLFQSPEGNSSSGDKMSAKDASVLAERYIKEFPEAVKMHRLADYTTETRRNPIKQFNVNSFLSYYNGSDGLAVGSVGGKYHIIATAQKKGFRLVAVVMGAKSESVRNADAAKLFNYGFSLYNNINKGKKGDVISSANVYRADGKRNTTFILEKDLDIIINIKNMRTVKVADEAPDYVTGDKKAGFVVGKRIVTAEGKTYTSNIVLSEDLPKASFWRRFFDTIALWVHLLLGKALGHHQLK